MADEGLRLVRDDGGLALTDGVTTVRGDFTRLLPRLKPARLRGELLIRAAKPTGGPGTTRTVDATAGLGDDAMLLAAAGCVVEMYERNPTVAALLEDALRRARKVPELAAIAARMHLVKADSIEALRTLPTPPDLILLDPMFPAKRKDAASKKKLQMLQRLEDPCADEEDLLRAALGAHPKKVVIKRPLKGPFLADVAPSYSIRGKTIRYDCIVTPRHDVC